MNKKVKLLLEETLNQVLLKEDIINVGESSSQLAKRIEEKFNLKLVRLIGSGNNGYAWLDNKKRTVKFTTSYEEYKGAKVLSGKNFKHFVKVFELGTLNYLSYEDEDDTKGVETLGWVIIKEYLPKVLDGNKERELSLAITKIEKGMETPNDWLHTQLSEVYRELKELGKKSFFQADISAANIGIDKNNNLVVFDFEL